MPFPQLNLDVTDPADDKQKLNWEKEFLGLYVSAHPLSEFATDIKDIVVPVNDLIQENNEELKEQALRVAGVITSVKKIITKKGESMVFARIEDTTNGVEVIVFPSVLRDNKEIWEEDKVVMMNCRLSDKDGETKLICNHVRELHPENVKGVIETLDHLMTNDDNGNKYTKAFQKKVKKDETSSITGHAYVLVPSAADEIVTGKLKSMFEKHPGDFRLFLAVKSGNGYKKISTNYMVDGSNELKEEVESFLGKRTFTTEDEG